MTRHRTYAAIDLDAIEYNYKNVRAKLPDGVKLLAVIKADAYGHGAVEIGRFLSGKCDFFGVACIEEALELKKAGIETPIIVSAEFSHGITPPRSNTTYAFQIFSLEDALSLSSEAVKQGKTAPFHFALDTGMSRIGLRVTEESADLCARISALSGLFAEGIFSHFATADESDLTKAVAQRDEFVRFMRMLAERGVNIPIKHLNNSAGIINFDRYFDMCRMGILTYGMYPSAEVRRDIIDVKPALSWHARISHIKTLEAGREISYGGTFTTVKPTVVATVPVGYADGYPRCLSNIGRVIIGGQYAPILGRVCMDQFMVDVSGIDCSVGDDVVLVGTQGDKTLTMEEVSEAAHSFNYELPCRISRRVPRVYFSGGKPIETKIYI